MSRIAVEKVNEKEVGTASIFQEIKDVKVRVWSRRRHA